jgi:hypothetical protein
LDEVQCREQIARVGKVPPQVSVPQKFDCLTKWLGKNERYDHEDGRVQKVTGEDAIEDSHYRIYLS